MAAQQLDPIVGHLRRLAAPAVAPPTDAELLGQFAARRDETAFAALVTRHGRLVLGLCRRVLGQEQDAEDAFQATFLVLARTAGSIRKAEKLSSWLHGVAYRSALHIKRSAARRRTHERKVQAMSPPQGSGEVCWRELQAVLDEELQRLPEKYRTPFVLCCLEGKSKGEAARELGWKEGTVSGRLAQARKQMQAALGRRGITLSAVLCAAAVAQSAAAIPPSVVAATVSNALRFCAGNCPGVPAGVAQRVIRSLSAARMRAVVPFLLGVALLGLATSALYYRACAARPEAPVPTAVRPGSLPATLPRPAPTDRLGDRLPTGATARFGTLRLRHNHTVAYVAFSTDDKRLTSGSWDHTIRFWDAADGRELRRITDKEGRFRSVAISPDGRLLAASCKDQSLRLWDTVTGTELRPFPNLDGAAGCVRFTPDGMALLTLTGSGFRLWDVATRKLQRQFTAPKEEPRSLTFTPDGRTLAGGCGNDVVLWDAATGKEQQRLTGHRDTVFYLAFSPDGKVLASGGGKDDRTARLWDLKTGRELHCLSGSPGWVRPVAFSPDGKLLAFGNADGTIHLHDTATGREVHRLETPGQGQKWVMALAFSPDGKTLASAGVGKSVLLWDVTTGQERPAPAGHRNEIGALAVTPDGKTLVSCADGQLIAWDASTGRARRQWSASGPAGALALTPDGKTLITPSGKDIRVWDPATGRQRRLLRGHKGNVDAVAVAAGGRMLASGGWQDHTIRLWDLSTGAERLVINLPQPNGLNYGDVPLAFSPDGKVLVSGSGDRVNRKIYFWDATTGKELRHLDREAVRLALSADGQTLVTTGWDSVARVWDVATLAERRQLPGAGGVLALSPDGKMLATGDTRGVIHLWEVATGKERRRLAGHESGASPGGGFFAGGVSALAFSGDGRSLFSGGGDTTALRWDVFAPGQQGSATDLGALWGRLGGEDAAGAYEAACVLLGVPNKAVGFLSGQLRPAPSAEPRRVAGLVADLDSPRFAVRQRASRALEEMGAAAHAELRKALVGNLSVEARRRVEALVERGTSRADPALLGRLRAVEVLEHAATPGALRLLRLLADGAPGSPLTREAIASLNRLKGTQAPR